MINLKRPRRIGCRCDRQTRRSRTRYRFVDGLKDREAAISRRPPGPGDLPEPVVWRSLNQYRDRRRCNGARQRFPGARMRTATERENAPVRPVEPKLVWARIGARITVGGG